MKLNAKEFKRRQQTPWQPKPRASFAQTSEQTGNKFGAAQARGRGRGRGRGRVVARNQPWVSGGVLKAGDFLGLRDNSAKFSADDDYTQLAASARSFAAASSNTHGYESFEDYGQAFAQQEPQRGGSNSSNMFTAYGAYTTQTSTSHVQTPSQSATRGRGRGFGVTRGGGVGGGGGLTKTPGKTSGSAAGASAPYRPRYSDMGYGIAVGTTTPQLMQSASQPVATEQYATAMGGDNYTSAGQQQQQQLYDTYTGYDYSESNAAYQQAAYYTTTDGQYLTTDTGIQYYSQF